MNKPPELPLALIMEEILGWEKRPGQATEEPPEEKENTGNAKDVKH